jgi:NAD(P)-dependent dehydrogenase (short-subunit alcohol dehydrogenase family)
MTSTSPHTTVLLIGASRSLGLAMVEEYLNYGSKVVATVRSAQLTDLHDLQDTSAGQLEIEHIAITIPEHIVALHNRLASRTFDLLSSTPASPTTLRTPSPTSRPRSSPDLWSPTR